MHTKGPIPQSDSILISQWVLHQIFGTMVQHAKKTWTQSDKRFCENEGSNRFKINEKGGHFDRKYRRKFIQNAQNMLNNTF